MSPTTTTNHLNSLDREAYSKIEEEVNSLSLFLQHLTTHLTRLPCTLLAAWFCFAHAPDPAIASLSFHPIRLLCSLLASWSCFAHSPDPAIANLSAPRPADHESGQSSLLLAQFWQAVHDTASPAPSPVSRCNWPQPHRASASGLILEGLFALDGCLIRSGSALLQARVYLTAKRQIIVRDFWNRIDSIHGL